MCQFSQIDLEEGGCSCLCTFPNNYSHKKLDKFDVESFALLGAAVALSHKGKLNNYDTVLIPNHIPRWVFEEIKRVCRTKYRGDDW